MNLRRISVFLILTVLLKLSSAFAFPLPHHGPVVAAPTEHALPACHDHQAPASAETSPKLDAVDSSQPSSGTCATLDNCHHCCAVGLGMYVPMLAQPLPSAAPVNAWTHGTSLSLRPDLRPPIA